MKKKFSHLLSSKTRVLKPDPAHGSAVTFLNTHMTMKSQAVRTAAKFLLSSEAGGLSTRSTETPLKHIHTLLPVTMWYNGHCALTSDRHLLAIEKDQQPQVMKIHHSDDECDDEGSHSHSFSSDDIIKDRNTSSPDSSFQSPSPGMSRYFSHIYYK